MKMNFFKFLFLLAIPIYASILEFTLKDGEVVRGELICERRGRLTLKSGSQAINIFKKSIKLYGDKDISGIREFILGDSLILRDKNEILYIITTRDDARVRLREILADGSERLVGEESGVSGDTLKFFVPDGRFYETVEYIRGEERYYQSGASFEFKTRCETFRKAEIELRGFPGDQIPRLVGEERKFKRDGE